LRTATEVVRALAFIRKPVAAPTSKDGLFAEIQLRNAQSALSTYPGTDKPRAPTARMH